MFFSKVKDSFRVKKMEEIKNGLSTNFNDPKYKIFDNPDEAYHSHLIALRKAKKKKVVENGNENDTTVVLHELLEDTVNHFYIYDRDLSGDLLKNTKIVNLLDKFKDFSSNKNHLIEIIIDDEEKSDKTLVEQLNAISSENKNIRIYKIEPNKLKEAKDEITLYPYFAVTDNDSYRFEDRKDILSREAIFNFEEKEMADDLKLLFEQLRGYCTNLN